MKKEVTNEFKDGLNLDLNPIVTPNTVLTDNLNGTFITYNGNEFCLQNDRGNIEKANLNEGFIPIGIKEHNGILYIVSVKENEHSSEEDVTYTTEIGSYPGIPNWDDATDENPWNFVDEYKPLQNAFIKDTVVQYVIYSQYDSDEMVEAGISADETLIKEIADRYDANYDGDVLFGNPGMNGDRIYFYDNTVRNQCFAEIDALYPNLFVTADVPQSEANADNAPDIVDYPRQELRFICEYSPSTPITIEVQDSYDGSVNLILVADHCKPRIINTGFSKLNDKEYKIIDRNQTVATNYYNIDSIAEDSELIRTSTKLVNFELEGVQAGGQLKGGNYIFYLKFGDGDYNKTDIVAESGIVSIFKGNDGVPSTISGTLADERTDKMVQLTITDIDDKYSKLYIYYTREYSDTQGFRMTESGALIDPIDINAVYNEETGKLEQKIWITGFEQTEPINIEELNVDYHTIDWARAEEQHSNMLFLGNVGQETTFELYKSLKDFTINHIITNIQYGDSVGFVDCNYSPNSVAQSEYYNVKNIYKNVGYWPDEYYRFGIVYILNDGSTTPVFNMGGGTFESIDNTIDNENRTNDYGVFKTPRIEILNDSDIKPLCFKFTLDTSSIDPRVIGYFIVRQKRIPLTICQGLSIGIDAKSRTPLTWDGSNWITESFLSYDRDDHTNEQWPELVYNEVCLGKDLPFNAYGDIFLELDFNECDTSGAYEFDGNIVRVPDVVESWLNDKYTQFITQNSISDSDVVELTSIEPGRWDNVDLYSAKYTLYRYLGSFDQETPNTGQYFIVYEDNQGVTWDRTYNSNRVYIVDSIDTTNESWWHDLTEEVKTQNWNQATYIVNNAESKKFINQTDDAISGSGLLCLDACVNSSIGSVLDGSEFTVRKEHSLSTERNGLLINNNIESFEEEPDSNKHRCVYVAPRTNMKAVDNYAFSTVVGDPTATTVSLQSVKSTNDIYLVSHYGDNKDETLAKEGGGVSYTTEVGKEQNETYMNINLLRGYFAPYVGVCRNITNNDVGLYSIRNEDNNSAFTIREQDNSPFYCISERISINSEQTSDIIVYRGDCFTNTISFRMQTNFIDATAPIANIIVDKRSWYKYVILPAIITRSKYDYDIDPTQINLSDVNTVSLGYWVTFKCLSSYNLGLRSVDPFHTDEMALLGSPRSFYPLNGASTATGNKMEESFLLNDGYSATVGEKRYNLWPDVPYSKSEFANRIMFSNVHITDAFTNGYRTFQGLAYKDYDKQYGAITKLIAYGQNLLVVMEHGIGLVSVNPKALMQTTTGEAIHIYGYGVLPNEMTIISQDYGSKYEHSVVRTPIGVYGIDVDAKKIWRFSDKQGFETFSDMKIETLLKDCLEPFNVNMSISDVRTHYNAFKGDLMFTWYITEGTIRYLWNICYNERQNVWVTRYGWVPIISENINDSFYSLQYNEAIPDDFVRIWSHTPDSKQELPDPTKWYDRQHIFEFEFVVSDPIGINKIFDNLQIISNNTQPNELEIAVIGDSYMAKRKPIVPTEERVWNTAINTENVLTTSNIHPGDIYGTFKYDWRLNENLLVKLQEFKDIYKFGRRIGNIHYRDGIWYSNIEPIIFKRDENDPGKQARIRDKWARIRIRYSGEDMAVITAIKTLINI